MFCQVRKSYVIENQSQYDDLAGEKGSIKYIAPVRAISANEPFTEECYFQNTKKYPYHFYFLKSFKEFENITTKDYERYCAERPTRIWWGGVIQFMQNNEILVYTIWTDDSLLEYVFSWPALRLAFVDCSGLSVPRLPVRS